eukprot:2931-Heterococcus_DN1.PRE.2
MSTSDAVHSSYFEVYYYFKKYILLYVIALMSSERSQLCVAVACPPRLKRTLRDRRVQQEASLTSLHRVVEGRSAQLSRQEARIRQRDDIMARTTCTSAHGASCSAAQLGFVKERGATVQLKAIRAVNFKQSERCTTVTVAAIIKNATGLSNLEDIIAHYQGRANKNQQLHALAEELRQRIEMQRKENQLQRHLLEEMKALSEITSGNREAYQEVDLVDAALG